MHVLKEKVARRTIKVGRLYILRAYGCADADALAWSTSALNMEFPRTMVKVDCLCFPYDWQHA
eukprot:4246430-Pleurochrysis_carterae.AAC.3